MSRTIEIHVDDFRSRSICKLDVKPSTTVTDIKQLIYKKNNLKVERQALFPSLTGKICKSEATIQDLGLQLGGHLYLKDLGPQIGWKTVFIVEYFGPLFVYPLVGMKHYFSARGMIEGYPSFATKIALVCWTIHFTKRLLETLFVHRFSHKNMPLANLFKNTLYYWGFAYAISYCVNHPLYAPPSNNTLLIGLTIFIICEMGNLSIHLLFRDLRPAGSKIRKIPVPNHNVFTQLFKYVCCPNYTYEAGAWFGFSIMTCCLTSFIFALMGLIIMSTWAIAKQHRYKSEFKTCPGPKALIPFIL